MTKPDEKLKFSQGIEEANVKHGITHIEAIVSHCEKTGLEIEMVKGLVTPQLKKKLEQEAIDLRFLPGKGSTLPL